MCGVGKFFVIFYTICQKGIGKMNDKEAREYLQSVNFLGIVPGLDTIRQLLKELGNPQEDLRFIHIAGTNGKGSVGAYISYILAASGYRVGRYVSPAILDECEKIQTLEPIMGAEADGKKGFQLSWIEKTAAAKHISKIKDRIEIMLAKGFAHPTEFEIETAMAFLELKERKCDIVVLETGMGGRLDATNIVETVECSVIVSISMDHMAFLGNTLEKIAEEKAGIIKKGIPVVSSPQKRRVEQVLRRKAKEEGSGIIFVDMNSAENIKHSPDGIDFLYMPSDCQSAWIEKKGTGNLYETAGDCGKLHLPLLGSHQVENALTAIETVRVLKDRGYQISWESMAEGLCSTVWHGRFEVLKRQPLVIVDGAHNEGAAERLAESIHQYILGNNFEKRNCSSQPCAENQQAEEGIGFQNEKEFNGKLIYVFGIFQDKEVERVIEKTARLADIIVTVTPDSPRGLPSEKLQEKVEEFWEKIGKKGRIEDCRQVRDGIRRALELAGEQDAVVIFGSLSLLHEIDLSLFHE